jgi:predicted TIM-barrel fold metal-dependent hydrolase
VDPRSHNHVEDEIERAAGLGFVALRVFPEAQGWSLDSVLFDRIVRACDANGLPLMVTADAAGEASVIVSRARNAGIPIILLGANYAVQAEAFSAAKAGPNTYVSTQFFVTPDAVEIAAEAVGADRLVLGTNSPDYSSRPAINMILRSRLSEDEKEQALGGNIARIIDGQLSKLGKTLSGSSDRRAYESRWIASPIIDVHAHIGPWPFPMGPCWADDLNRLMDRRGIVKTVISSTKAIVNDFVEGNAELARAIEGSKSLFGYVTVNPNCVEKSIQEMEKYLPLPEFVGVKFHPSYAGLSIDCPAFRPIVESAARWKVPFLIHTWGHGEPTKVLKLAEEFPDVPFIMGHGGVVAWEEAIDVIKKTKNTYTEFSSSLCPRGKGRKTLDEVGCERVVLGTDLGLFDPAYDMGIYEEANMTAQEQRAVAHDNASRLFGFK